MARTKNIGPKSAKEEKEENSETEKEKSRKKKKKKDKKEEKGKKEKGEKGKREGNRKRKAPTESDEEDVSEYKEEEEKKASKKKKRPKDRPVPKAAITPRPAAAVAQQQRPVDAEAGGDDAEQEDESRPTGNVLLRLYPCPARVKPDSEGVLRYRDGTVVVMNNKTRMDQEYVLRENLYDVDSIVKVWPAVAAKGDLDRIKLPMMAVGSRTELEVKEPAKRPHKPRPLVRANTPKQEFLDKFRINKFSATEKILLVPILSVAEATEYLQNRVAFLTKMLLPDNMDKRTFWICDGATRWGICNQ